MKEIGAAFASADKQNDRAKLTVLHCTLEGTNEMQREITPDYVQMVKEWKL